MTNPILRKEIFKLLLKRPLRSSQLWQSKTTHYSWKEIEQELKLLIEEGLVVPRNHRFFLRDRSKAQTFITEQRYVRMVGAKEG